MTSQLELWPPAPSVVTACTPSVTHLLSPNASPWTYEGTNSWVIAPAGGSASVIVDPGSESPDHLAALRAAATDAGRNPIAVLVTHWHDDHYEGARTLAASLGVPVAGLLATEVDRPLCDGEVIDVDGLAVTVVATPGHSEDSLSLWIAGERSMLTGDTILGGRSAGVYAGLASYLGSLDRLDELARGERTTALPGHGTVVPDLAAVVERVRGVRLQRVDQVRDLIAQGQTTVRGIVGRLYPHVHGPRIGSAVKTVITMVDHLVGLGDELGIPDAAQRAAVAADVERVRQKLPPED